MFTGIIEESGVVKSVKKAAGKAILSVNAKICISGTKKGDSISVNGSCLTVTGIQKNCLDFDVSPETLEKTNLAFLKIGQRVNLERSLSASSRLGGHFVTGHIDCVGIIRHRQKAGSFLKMGIELPKAYMSFLAEKGSIAVDGISLTVNSIREAYFYVMLIPHTIKYTTLARKQISDTLNIETDILAKYINSTLKRTGCLSGIDKKKSSIDLPFLSQHGFA
jgi:riboflavin synthase